MKVAFVYDRVNKFGGAERVLLALHKIWPKAPLYTAVYNPKGAPWAKDFKIIPSFLQKFPFAKSHHEIYPLLMSLAFESFDFSNFEVVISITSAEAKGIITKPKTLHICYCLTPTRYLWSGHDFYKDNQQFGLLNVLAKPIFLKASCYLKKWDNIASQRPDCYLAISKEVKARILKYYQQDCEVIYPPVDIEKFNLDLRLQPEASTIGRWASGPGPPLAEKSANTDQQRYFLVVSRLVPYKRIDLAVKAFNKLGLKLKIIGVGSEYKKLIRIAKDNIEFLGQLTDNQLIGYYQNCAAFVFPGEEDFGLSPIEAQAAGKPAIAYRKGGARETVIDGKTGIFFEKQTVDSLRKAILRFESLKFKSLDCLYNAKRFNKAKFIKKFKSFVEEKWQQYKKKLI